MGKNTEITRDVNGVTVEQRVADGFLNGTAMCTAHGKKIVEWFSNQSTIDLVKALAENLGIELKGGNSHLSSTARVSAAYPQLVVSKKGSPENGGGTWLHPDLALQLAQWCNPLFAIQVSRWVREWMTTGQNPLYIQADIDRLGFRDTLKNETRLELTEQIKKYLEQMQLYDDKRYCGIYFAKVHDRLNILLTTETSKQMRTRLSKLLGREVKEYELIRDYFPTEALYNYKALCQVATNLMKNEWYTPLDAVKRAAKLVLPIDYLAKPIDFDKNIKLVRGRVAALRSGQGSLALM